MPGPLSFRIEADDGTAVGVVDGRIAPADQPFELSVTLGPGELRPGLINAHDHLHRNHYPPLGAPPYPDAYAWGRDLHDRWADEIARGRSVRRRDALLFGALKNLLGGATTVVHHDPWEPDFDRDFPLRVVHLRTVHSLRFEEDAARRAAGPEDLPLCIHLAEGTTPESAGEVAELDRMGLLDERLLAVHAVGVESDGIERLVRAGAAIVWCPTSNLFLFGRTVPSALIRSGVDVLLGSDSLLTGRGTLLDELRAARELDLINDARLLAAVGEVAARRLRLPHPSLAPGSAADLVHLRRSALRATAQDVALVLVAGVPRLADEEFGGLFEFAGVQPRPLQVGATSKLVHASLVEVVERVLDTYPEATQIIDIRLAGSRLI